MRQHPRNPLCCIKKQRLTPKAKKRKVVKPLCFLVSVLIAKEPKQPRKPLLCEENILLIMSRNPVTALTRAEKIGQRYAGVNVVTGKTMRYLGITELIPVYDDFEDGNEVGYRDWEITNETTARRGLLDKSAVIREWKKVSAVIEPQPWKRTASD